MKNSHTGKSDFGYKTDDYSQVVATEIPYGDDDFAIKSGYLIGIRKEVYYHDRYGSRCSVAANPKTCFETNLLDDWYTYRLNDNIMLPENLQYVYIAESKIFGSLVVTLYPPQTADIEETEALFTKILKTVELIEPEE